VYLAGEPGTEDTRISKSENKKGHKLFSASTKDDLHRFHLSLFNTKWLVVVDASNQLEIKRVI
jgi:hypothetical protein